MQAQQKPGPGPGLNSLYGGITDFSNLLTSALGNIDNNVNTLQTSNTSHQEQIESLKTQVKSYGAKLKQLETEAEAQRSKLEKAMLNVSDMGKNIDTQLSETTKQMHRELLTQRTTTKMDLFALNGSIRNAMNEAMDLIAESPKLLKSTPMAAHNPNSSPEESIQYLLEKLKVLEEALMIQHNVNLQLSNTVKNDDVIQKVYDTLYDQISGLEIALNQANAQNEELKDKYHRELGKVRDAQTAQQDQIAQLTGALLSNKNMKKFKQTMSRIAEAQESDKEGLIPLRKTVTRALSGGKKRFSEEDGLDTTDTAASKERQDGEHKERDREEKHIKNDSKDEADECFDEGEKGTRRRSKGEKRHRRRRHRHSDSESEEEREEEAELEEETDGGDQFNENGVRRLRCSTVKARRHRHHSHRRPSRHREPGGHDHHRHHDETTAPVGRDTVEAVLDAPPTASPAAVANAPSTSSAAAVVALAPEGSTGRSSKDRGPAEFKRSKTFNSSIKDEKETQTTRASNTNAGTNTDKPSAKSAGTSPPGTAGAHMDGVEKMVFDDEASLDTMEQKDIAHTASMYRVDSFASMDSSCSYYDSDSYYSGSFLGGGVTVEQLEKVAADAKHSMEQLRADCTKRTDELEESVLTFKRIALMLEDMKINYDLLKAKVDGLGGAGIDSAGGSGGSGSFDDMRATSQYHSIQHAKLLWAKVHGELLFGLEKFSENDSDAEDGNVDQVNVSELTRNSRQFSKKAAALVAFLDSNLAAFHPAESVAATLKTVAPTLEQIYRQAMDLDSLDDAIKRTPGSVDSCQFSALSCSDNSNNLKNYLREAMAASVPVLDESIPKVAMRQRIEQLEKALNEKADKTLFSALQDELRSMDKTKVDVKEFLAAVSKLATAAELAKLNMYVADIGGRGSTAGYSNTRSDAVFDIERAELGKNSDFQALVQRFEVLGRQQQDLHSFCGGFVPREEVHEALKAIIGEVKALKQSTVNQALFRDGLKNKADIAEVERVVKSISDAVGDLNIKSADAAAAIHAKCLICDKPVTGGAGRARTAVANNRRSTGLVSTSMPMLGYSKAMDDSSVHSEEDGGSRHMFNRLTSVNPAVAQTERAKVATELAILRSTIDPLPDILDQAAHSDTSQLSTSVGGGSQYKQRIRHSAGGGVGPAYKKDTR